MSLPKVGAELLEKNAKEAAKIFLDNYWQKRPLLIRGAFPGGISHIDPDSLAGLACQEGIDSRVVTEHGKDYAWQTQDGPFAEDFFSSLPKTHWTLLVQAVDRLVPEVSALREKFRFLPNWRLDDIMISYAVDKGSVGPHTDNYDVFLIQAMGQRRWEYSSLPLDLIEFEDGLDLKILKNFKADEMQILEEGDMLYLPPHVAHHGVAVGECMTYSVGFRAPTQNEMLVSFAQFLMQTENPDIFFADDAFVHAERLAKGPGLLFEHDKGKLRELMIRAIEDDAVFNRWVGGFLTEPRHFHEPVEEISLSELKAVFSSTHSLHKVEGGRFAYLVADGKVYLSVEGETLVLNSDLEDFARVLCEGETWLSSELLQFSKIQGFGDTMLHLWNQGFIRAPE